MDDTDTVLYKDWATKEATFDEYTADLKEYIEFCESNRKNPNATYASTYYLYKLVEKWQPVLGFNETAIQGHIVDIQSPKLDFRTSLSIKEVMRSTDSTSSWIVPGIFQSCGMYILGGDPKAGKSVLCYALAYAVCVSGEFLGMPVKTGNVLFLQLEEPFPTMKKRFGMAGFSNINPDEDASLLVNFESNRLRIERSFDLTRDINWLIKTIQKYEPSLVIIDSLRKATARSSQSENTNEFGKLVYALQSVFTLTNTCGIVIHHLSKEGQDKNRKHDLIQRLAGHTSISAASDGLIGLFDKGRNNSFNTVALKTKPRDGFALNLTYEWNTSSEGLWEFKATESDSPAKLIETSQILRCLSHSEKELATGELAQQLELSATNTEFQTALKYLVELELITVRYINRKAYYSFSESNMWLVKPTTIKSLVSGAVLDANNLMRCTDKAAIRELVTDWSKSRKRDAFYVLLPEEQTVINELISSREFSVGQKVVYEDNSLYTIQELIGAAYSLNDNEYVITDIENEQLSLTIKESEIRLYTDELSAVASELSVDSIEVDVPLAIEM